MHCKTTGRDALKAMDHLFHFVNRLKAACAVEDIVLGGWECSG